jgi:hypothetical protein
MANQPEGPQVFEIAMPEVGVAVTLVAKVVNRYDPKSSNGCERADFRAPKVVVLIAQGDRLTIETPGEVETVREDVPGIDRFDVARITIRCSIPFPIPLTPRVVPPRIIQERHDSTHPLLQALPEVVVKP